jgi:hypothetical protein
MDTGSCLIGSLPKSDKLVLILCSSGAVGSVIRLLTALDGVIYFSPMHGHFARCLYAETNLVTSDFDDDNGDVVVDYNALVFFARKY